MSTIALSAGVLRAAFSALYKVAPLNPTLPVLGYLEFTRERNLLQIAATDLDRHLTYTHQVEPAPLTGLGVTLAEIRWKRDAGRLLVPASAIYSATKAVRDDAAAILLEEGAISYPLGGGLVRMPFAPIAPAEFPASPEVLNEQWLTLDAAHRAALLEANQYASEDNARYILNGVFLDGGPDGPPMPAIIATDGRRLFHRTAPGLAGLREAVVIPSATVKLLGLPAILAQEWRLGIDPQATGGSRVVIHAGPWRLISKTIEGNYPNYRQVIPTELDQHATCLLSATQCAELREVLARLPKAPRKGSSAVTLRFFSDHLSLEVPALGVSVSIPGIGCNAPIVTAIDRGYLADLLATGPGVFRMLEATSPILYLSGPRVAVIMPMTVPGPEPGKYVPPGGMPDPELDAAELAWRGKWVRFGTWPEAVGKVSTVRREGTRLLLGVCRDMDIPTVLTHVPISAGVTECEEPIPDIPAKSYLFCAAGEIAAGGCLVLGNFPKRKDAETCLGDHPGAELRPYLHGKYKRGWAVVRGQRASDQALAA